MAHKLGKKLGVVHDPRTLKFEAYSAGLPVPPPKVNHTGAHGQTFAMYDNDSIGDCTCAAIGNMVRAISRNANQISEADILKAYEDVSGYDPSTGANDDGAYCVDVLNYWSNTGIGSNKAIAWVKIDTLNDLHVKQAIYLFGGIYTGFALPEIAQTQTKWGLGGDTTKSTEPGSWGGHCVPGEDFGPDHLTCVTWAKPLAMTWEFWNTYCQEAYAVITQDWLDRNFGKSPQGFDLATLQADAKLLSS